VTRKSLSREIQSVSQRLNLRQAQFHLTNERVKVALKKTNPYLIMATGLIAGAVTGAMGWRKAYTAVRFSFSFYSFLLSLPSRLMGTSNG
tara:strand:- start:376 stop:645 length:270 start_codon:yes stop_codon:yes gene_type:complete